LNTRRDSFQQDHWGFYNGAEKNDRLKTMIPSSELRVIGTEQWIQLEGADREPNEEYLKACILEKIIYPTGGSSTFDFEAHKYKSRETIYETNHAHVELSIQGPNDYGRVTANKKFTIPLTALSVPDDENKTKVKIEGFATPLETINDLDVTHKPWAALSRVNGTEREAYFTSQPQSYVSTPIYKSLYKGVEYQLSAEAWDHKDTYASIRVEWEEKTGKLITERIAGGLRVKRIISSAGVNSSPDIIKEYKYKEETDTEASSGRLVSTPVYEYFQLQTKPYEALGTGRNQTQCYSCSYLVRFSSTKSELGTSQGSHIGYTYVTENHGVGGINGKSTYTYSFEYEDPSISMFPFPYANDKEWYRGHLLTNIDYEFDPSTDKFNRVKEVITNYNFESSDRLISEYKGLKVGYAIVESCQSKYPWYEKYRWIYYNVRSIQVRPVSKVERLYDKANGSYIENRTNFYYQNQAHNQLTRIENILGNGKKRIIEYKYPLDYPSASSNSNNPAAAAIGRMNMDHIINPVLETLNWEVEGTQSPKLLSSELKLFRTEPSNAVVHDRVLALTSTLPIADYSPTSINGTGSLAYDTRFRNILYLDKYDDKVNLLQFRKEAESTSSYIWSYNQTYPVAKIINGIVGASLSDVTTAGHSSFEVDYADKKNSNYWGDGTSHDEGKTGRKSIQIGASETWGPSRDFVLNSENAKVKYVFSCWVKVPKGSTSPSNGALIIYTKRNSDTDHSTHPSSGSRKEVSFSLQPGQNWQYVEAVLDLDQVSVPTSNFRIRCYIQRNSDGALLVDEVRFHRADAQMTTYTYDPLIGMTSSTDERGITTYYEYDSFGRLEAVKDQERNIIKSYKYNYAQ
jgi:YD repeat-containing protein